MTSKSSYKTILKSTSFVGGAKVISTLIQIVRTKAIAVMLGPSGVGLIGALNASISLVQTLVGLGVGFSAVRDIAKANETGDKRQISETVFTLRRVVYFTGALGALLTILLSSSLSRFTFGSDAYSLEIKLLSFIVFISLVQGGQNALIQGMRRIKDLSKLTVWGAAFGTVFSIPLIYFFREDGIVPFLIMVAAAQLFVSWRYARKIKLEKVRLSIREVIGQSRGMIRLGFAFMGAGLTAAAALYLIRVIIIRYLGIEAAGFYQAAMAISTLYIGVILDAMSKDFYPRLTAVAEDRQKAIQIINEQTEIGVLIAAPGLLITLALAPMLISLFYSAEFAVSYEILRWMILGIFLRVISWPMGFLFVAKGKGKVFFLTQLLFNTVHLALIFVLVPFFGIIGTGIGFFLLYVVHVLFMKTLVYKENGFTWSRSNKRDFLLLSVVFAASFYILIFTSEITGVIVVTSIALLVFYYTIRRMMKIFKIDSHREVLSIIKRKVARNGSR